MRGSACGSTVAEIIWGAKSSSSIEARGPLLEQPQCRVFSSERLRSPPAGIGDLREALQDCLVFPRFPWQVGCNSVTEALKEWEMLGISDMKKAVGFIRLQEAVRGVCYRGFFLLVFWTILDPNVHLLPQRELHWGRSMAYSF